MSDKALTIQDLLDAGLHFGHQTKRWNPKMKRFIHGAKGGIYVIDLQKTLVQLKLSKEFLTDTVMNGRKILFVGTKKQARSIFREAAEKANQPYVVYRWMGGMLTNSQTVRQSVKRMEDLQSLFNDETVLKSYPKKEQSALRRELNKLERNLTGIRDMTSLPGAMFIVDICREKLAIAEAQRLNIPVVALVDTNADPDQVDYPVPGNDDSIRSLSLIADELGSTIAEAHEAYTKQKEAQAKERREKEEAERKAAEKARTERKAKEDEERKKRAKVLEKLKKEKAAAEKAKKKEAEKAEFKAREAADKEAAEKAAAEKAAEPAKEEPKAEEPVKAEAPAEETASDAEAAPAEEKKED
jgi:small subunit ribosomal protein S2